eukprot:TRINITY_DN3903_c0_g1_i2.p1 TRINITY_DN3903_c0_g1~~TRINITY_DN3903_c0_g1_i2.p1  ORF type:complete len:277 (-),score=68.04 TRINITY_DN3903_c0_g1_i2:96-926(-)
MCIRDRLCVCFLAMVLGHTPRADWLPAVDATGGIVTGYALAVQDAEQRGALAGLGDVEFTRHYLRLDYEMSLSEYLKAADACWVDPLSEVPLVPGGLDRRLLPEHMKEYLQAVLAWWFDVGVKGQVSAFVQGFGEVVPVRVLGAFSPPELLCMLCGDNSVVWDSSSLHQNLRPTASLTTNSPVFQLLVQYLLKLDNPERAAFLNFVTACPRLPPGGVAALNIEVGPSATESKIPTSQTCVPKLYIPNYGTIAELHTGFKTAFTNAEEGGFHERAID